MSWKELRTRQKIGLGFVGGFFLILALVGLFFGTLDCLQRGNPYSEYKLESFYVESPRSDPTAVLEIYSKNEERLDIKLEVVLGSSYPGAWGSKSVLFKAGQRQTVKIPIELWRNPTDPMGLLMPREAPYDKVIIWINGHKFIRK